MAEFTKGPWVIDAFTKSVVAMRVPDDGGDIICSKPDGDASASRWNANASLIAAAPDLYEALKPFAALADKFDAAEKPEADDLIIATNRSVRVTLGDCRAARSSLARAEGKGET